MTERQQNSVDFIKKNWLTFSNMVLIIGLIIKVSMWMQSVDDRLRVFEKHIEDTSVHMPLEKKLQIFTTQTQHSDLVDKIDRIDAKVDLLLKKELNK